jgi:thioredoxin 2
MASNIVTCVNCGARNRVPGAAQGTPRCGKCHQPLPWVVPAGDDDFAEVAEASAIPVVVDFWAPWCGPCRMVSPALEQVAGELAGQVKLVKVNIDEAAKLAERFSIQAVPTLVVMKNGKVLAQQPGAAPAPALRAWVDQALRANP